MSGHTPWHELNAKSDDPPRATDGPSGWTAYILCAGAPTMATDGFDVQIGNLTSALRDWRGAVSSGREGGAYGATFSLDIESTSVAEVVDEALAVFSVAARRADLPPWPIVRCEVLTFAELDRDLDEGGYVAMLELDDEE